LAATTFTQLTEHVYWMTPGPPDRPSLGAVVGDNYTLMLDGASSSMHTRLFLAALDAAGIARPAYVALTHWHWDHVFGAVEVGAPVIAHTLTADELAVMAEYAWDNASLDRRVAAGKEMAFCAENIKIELPEPRRVRIPKPAIVFSKRMELHLGGDVTCAIEHVGGEHAPDSCVMHILPDRVLFLGDCLYHTVYGPTQHYTTKHLFPLLDKILSFDAEYYIEGHGDTALTRAQLETMAGQMHLAGTLVERIGRDEPAVFAAARESLGAEPDEDMAFFLRAFMAGKV
jgi:glyoxylase-like metal-dependent hydrolase (beta-lactamase superfamily II)